MNAAAPSPFVAYRDLVLAKKNESSLLRDLVLNLAEHGQPLEWRRGLIPSGTGEAVAAAMIAAVQGNPRIDADLVTLARDVRALRDGWEREERLAERQAWERRQAANAVRTARRLAKQRAEREAAQPDPERQAFEAEVMDLFDPPLCLARPPGGEYENATTRDIYLGWLLRAFPGTPVARQALGLQVYDESVTLAPDQVRALVNIDPSTTPPTVKLYKTTACGPTILPSLDVYKCPLCGACMVDPVPGSPAAAQQKAGYMRWKAQGSPAHVPGERCWHCQPGQAPRW